MQLHSSGWQQPPIVPHPVRNAASLAISTPSPPTHAWRYSISGKGSLSIAFTAEIRCRCWPSAAIPPGRSWVMSSMRKMCRRESSPRAAAAAPSAAAFAAARPAIVCARAASPPPPLSPPPAAAAAAAAACGSFASRAYAVLSRSFRWRRTLGGASAAASVPRAHDGAPRSRRCHTSAGIFPPASSLSSHTHDATAASNRPTVAAAADDDDDDDDDAAAAPPPFWSALPAVALPPCARRSARRRRRLPAARRRRRRGRRRSARPTSAERILAGGRAPERAQRR